MSCDEDSYKTHQQKWEDLNEWGYDYPELWEEDELRNNEELLAEMEAERRGRERARIERIKYGIDVDEGHDDRIEKLKDTEQTVRNTIAYCKGEYEYDEEEQSVEGEEQESEVPSDMALCSDSD